MPNDPEPEHAPRHRVKPSPDGNGRGLPLSGRMPATDPPSASCGFGQEIANELREARGVLESYVDEDGVGFPFTVQLFSALHKDGVDEVRLPWWGTTSMVLASAALVRRSSAASLRDNSPSTLAMGSLALSPPRR